MHSILDNTILWVDLEQPLAPGDSTEFFIEFKTYFGSHKRRMNYNPHQSVPQFNAAHWYPRIAVYDRKSGWNTNQHLEREFYGDFGTFEVDITLPNDYICAATGFLLNRDEVLPDTLMQALDIVNFLDKPWGGRPSLIIQPIDGKMKTWRYKAVNVHDFAWTADPSYRIGVAEWDDVKCYAFVREWKAAYWQDAAQFAADVIRTYSQDFGQYGYHKMIVVDADDGMEYPMITFDGDYSPDYYDLLAHEIGHNWFYAMVGSNETYQAFLDEGLTQFLTAWAVEKLVKTAEENAGGSPAPYTGEPKERYSDYVNYYDAVKSGRDITLETHSDKIMLEGKGLSPYWQVYYKTGVMLFNLQYVLGEELYQKAMNHYFEKWKFCHPYSEDFYDAITEYTKWDLRWFFDQWARKVRTIDYAIDDFDVHPAGDGDGWRADIKLRRKGTAIMPLDLVFTFADQSKQTAIVPVGYNVKEEGDPLVLSKWTGWGDFNATYETSVKLDKKPVYLEIDPSGRLADVNRLDNYSTLLPRMEFFPYWQSSDWATDKYKVLWWPTLGYNDIDGLRLGIQFDGGYMNRSGYGDHQIDFSVHANGNLPDRPLSYRFVYTQPMSRLNREAFFTFASEADYGYAAHGIGFQQMLSGYRYERHNYTKLNLALKLAHVYDNKYLWSPGFFNDGFLSDDRIFTFDVDVSRVYSLGKRGRQRGSINLSLTSALPGSNEMYNKIQLTTKNLWRVKKIRLRTRSMLGYGTKNTPLHSMFYANMGSPAQWISNSWLATRGALPTEWVREGHLQPAGGGNLRGVNHYMLDQTGTYGQLEPQIFGNRIAAFNAEFALWNPIKSLVKKIPYVAPYLQFTPYGFGDIAVLGHSSDDAESNWGDALIDGGIGIMWKPRVPRTLAKMLGESLKIRFDVPFYLNRPADGDDEIEFRWTFGLGSSF